MERPPEPFPFVQVGQSIVQGFYGLNLHLEIHGGIYFQPFPVQGVSAVFFQENLSDIFGKVGRFFKGVFPFRFDNQFRVKGLFIGLGSDPFFFQHPLEHISLPGLCPLEMFERGIPRGGLGKTCKQGRLGEIQLLGRFVEIGPGGGFYAIGALTQVDLVQIEEKNVIL